MPCVLDVWQYGLNTTPRLEWNWAMKLEWDGEKVQETMGGYVKEGWSSFTDREDPKLRRKAVSIQQLHANAPKLICSMLTQLVQSRGQQAFVDADDDGKIDAQDMLTENDIRRLYDKLNVNTAELLGLRMYTGMESIVPPTPACFVCNAANWLSTF